MKKNIFKHGFILLVSVFVLAGCGDKMLKDTSATASEATEEISSAETPYSEEESVTSEQTHEEETASFDLEDGVYKVDFDTDNSMFHVNECYEGKAKLVVENGKALLYLVMPSKNILNLYLGRAEDAQEEGADLIAPSTVSVTYADGEEDEVYAFEVPVTVYGEDFDLALIGKKEVWYDHKVKISNAEPWSEPDKKEEDGMNSIKEGIYQVPVSLEGGTGKTSLESPAKVEKKEDGYIVTLIFSSKYYDYMLVDDVKYLPIDNNDHSVFEIPVSDISAPLHVVADTVAMSKPHEIEYTITFDSESVQ